MEISPVGIMKSLGHDAGPSMATEQHILPSLRFSAILWTLGGDPVCLRSDSTTRVAGVIWTCYLPDNPRRLPELGGVEMPWWSSWFYHCPYPLLLSPHGSSGSCALADSSITLSFVANPKVSGKTRSEERRVGKECRSRW